MFMESTLFRLTLIVAHFKMSPVEKENTRCEELVKVIPTPPILPFRQLADKGSGSF